MPFKIITIITLLAFVVSCSESISDDQQIVSNDSNLTIPEKIAFQYGLSQFEKIKTIEFRFNVKKGEVHIDRHWKWNPKTNQVILFSDNNKKEFVHNNCTLKKEIELDEKFTNDSYWLLFPYHLIWDKQNYEYSISKNVVSPMSNNICTKLTINYLKGDGFTPNDTYELYLDKSNEITEWIYRKNGSENPTRITSWEEIIDIDGVKISTLHIGDSGNFKVWFDQIRIEN